jgi:hypothetical protein
MTLFVVLILVMSELPDPGQPTFPNICGTFAGFAGMAFGIGRRCDWERTMKRRRRLARWGTGSVSPPGSWSLPWICCRRAT